jgi:hypothetical protein
MNNSWFQVDLPEGALHMNDFYSNCSPLPAEVTYGTSKALWLTDVETSLSSH